MKKKKVATLEDSRIAGLLGSSAILNLLTVRVVAQEYNFLVCEFEGFKSLLRGWGHTGHPYIASTDDAMIYT